MKQITIYDLLPLLRRGWVAMDECGAWYWYDDEPTIQKFVYGENKETYHWNNSGDLFELSELFNIAPFDGSWKDSLIKVDIRRKNEIH